MAFLRQRLLVHRISISTCEYLVRYGVRDEADIALALDAEDTREDLEEDLPALDFFKLNNAYRYNNPNNQDGQAGNQDDDNQANEALRGLDPRNRAGNQVNEDDEADEADNPANQDHNPPDNQADDPADDPLEELFDALRGLARPGNQDGNLDRNLDALLADIRGLARHAAAPENNVHNGPPDGNGPADDAPAETVAPPTSPAGNAPAATATPSTADAASEASACPGDDSVEKTDSAEEKKDGTD